MSAAPLPDAQYRILVEHSPRPFDAVVLDLMMPVLGGAGLVRELQTRGTHVPTLLMSATSDLRAQAREIAADDFLEKPFNPDCLEAKLKQLVYSGSSGPAPTASSAA